MLGCQLLSHRSLESCRCRSERRFLEPRALADFGSEAFGVVAFFSIKQNAVFDGHQTRSYGISQAGSLARRAVRRRNTGAMACTSFRNWNVFKTPRPSFGVPLYRRPSDDRFLWFKHRTKGGKCWPNAVQADMGKREIQETSTTHSIYHTVKEGDTLTSIARKFETSVQLIALSNQINDIDYIPVGKVLSVSTQSKNLNEVSTKSDNLDYLSTLSGSPAKAEPSITAQKGSTPLMIPMLASSFSSQIHLVKLASALLILYAVFSFGKRYLGSWVDGKIQKEVLKRQAEKEILDVHHRPKLRWQGILDEDREKEEPDMALSADGQIPVESEEEKLRQSYAQLECVYAKFLVDSGLSKSGYWRGGVPPAPEED